MVTIIGCRQIESADGKPFIAVEVEGEPELVQSLGSGRFYLTSRKTIMATTLSESTAQRLIGTSIAGNVVRVSCDPYEFTVEETGEVITLAHKYQYEPEPETIEPQTANPLERSAQELLSL